jgi:hypothetical protein
MTGEGTEEFKSIELMSYIVLGGIANGVTPRFILSILLQE